MEFHEMIQIRGEPFPQPLPRPPEEMISLLESHGLKFTDELGVLRLRGKYDPRRLDHVRQVLAKNKLELNLWRSVWATYDEGDFAKADLLLPLGIPEIWVRAVDFAATCENCGRKRFEPDSKVRVQHLDTGKPIVMINGQVPIIRTDLCCRFQQELSGAVLSPADNENRYHYLMARQHLRHLIIPSEQVIGYRGECPNCSLPMFDQFFGPLRYASKEWSGDDVVFCDFLSCNAYTKKGFELLRKIEKKVVRDGIVLLERG